MNHSKKVANATCTDLDRISQLPEPIILHIQSFLPLKDAARTCILSKTWKDICSLYPILYFDHNLFGLQFLLSHTATAESGSVFDSSQVHEVIMDKFLDFVDYRLSRINHENRFFQKLGLSISLAESDITKYSSRVDHWMELVTQAPWIEDLCFSVQANHGDVVVLDFSCNLKLPILATKGLQFLSLQGCSLQDRYSNYNMKICSSLRRLYMSKVIVKEDAWDSLACCLPLIEIIELTDCYTNFEKLAFSKFSKSLKKATLCDNFDSERVSMTGTNLESFKYDSFVDCEMDVTACSCIRELRIEGCNFYLQGQLDFFQDFTTVFPVLEQVHIFALPVNSFGSICLKVASHHHLKTLYLHVRRSFEKAYITDCPNLTSLIFHSSGVEELYIDCPNLREFIYCGSLVPSVLLFHASADMRCTKWVIDPFRVDMSWFIQLKKLVKQLSQWTVDLYLTISSATASFTSEEHLDEVQAFVEGCNVNLELGLLKEYKQNDTSLLSWLLWSSYPSTLDIYGYGYDLCKHLYDKLSNESEEDKACNDKPFCNEHWWHHVKDFEVDCCHRHLQCMKDNLPALVQQTMSMTFRFHWYSYDMKAL